MGMKNNPLSISVWLIILTVFYSGLSAQIVSIGETDIPPVPLPVLDKSVPIGPVFPPPLGVTWNGSGNSGGAGGATWNYQDILLANYDLVYWGTANDAILLSFNDSIYTTNEIMRFNSTLSNLSSGFLVWTGNTFFPARPDTVFTRFTIRLRNYANGDELSALPADSVLLPANVGGVLWIYGGLAFTVNFIYESSFTRESQYQPAFDFFDANKQGAEVPYLSFNAGFYYVNSDPTLTANNILTVNEGQQILLTVDYLSASDIESDKTEIFFNIAPQDMGDAPHAGWLKRDDVPMQKGDSFTLDDLEQNRIYYEHDGNESTWDNFTFNVSDGDGGVTPGGEFLTFTFNFSIIPQNDSPQPGDKSARLRMNTVLYESLSAIDVDTPAQILLFSITENGKKGVASILNDTTGLVSYTPDKNETGADTIYFQVYDGIAYAREGGQFILKIDPIPELPAGNLLFGDPTNARIRILNPSTGLDTVYVDLFKPDMQQRTEIRDLVLDSYGDLFILTADTGLLRTDYLSGETTQLIPADSFSFPLSIDRASNGDLFICDGVRGILKLDHQSGNFTVLAAGDLLTFPAGIDMSTDGFLYVTDVEDLGISNGRIVRIDPETGAQVLISSETYLSDPVGITTTNEGIIYVADMNAFGGSGHVVKINAQNGSQEILTSGQNLIDPFGIDLYDSRLYVSDFNTKSIVEIDTAAGNQSVLFADTSLQNLMGIFVIQSTITSVPQRRVVEVAQEYALGQNYPNPFNPGTTIHYSLPRASRIKIDIYDITGQFVKTILNEDQKAGQHSVTFNTKNQASGIYVYRMIVNGRSIAQRRMVLLK